jgi:hypothetical protein
VADASSFGHFRRFRASRRPKTLVIDQDAVFIASETFWEVIKTRAFEDFCSEQELSLWVCNKADPESKGPVENAVGFVKKNFFSARTISCVDDVWRSLPGWLERKNKRIHRTILRVPNDVLAATERAKLSPLLPSVYENSPSSFKAFAVSALPYVLHKSIKYSVPRDDAFKTVLFKTAAGKIHIYDSDRAYICSHPLSERKGSVNKLPEHNRQGSDDWVDVMERMLVAAAMKECCEGYRYKYSQFRAVFSLAKAGRAVTSGTSMTADAVSDVEHKSLEVYSRAYRRRVEETGVATR